MADVFQAEYEQLAQIASRFGQQAEQIEELHQQVKQAFDKLESGDWQGVSAEAFTAEMNAEVLPAVQRLIAALKEAQTVTTKIAQLIQQAEEEGAAVWKDWTLDGQAPAGGGGGAGGGSGGGNKGFGVMDAIHGALDIAGFVPGLGAVPDLINAGIYAIEGDGVNAAISAAAAVPIIGDAVKGADKIADAAKIINRADDIADATKAIDNAGDAAKAIDNATDATKAADEAAAALDAARNRAKGLDAADGGHSIDRHGPELTDTQLKDRLTTGRAPDGAISPTPTSTKFRSYDDWERTRTEALDQIASREGIDLTKPPAPGAPDRYTRTIDHGHPPIGDGFEGANSQKIPHPNNPSKKIKVFNDTNPVPDITRTTTTVQWNPGSGRWEVKQHFPEGRASHPTTTP